MNNKVKVYPNRNSTIKETLVHNKDETNYWTEYNRTHNLLGAKRGPGETRNLSSRINYNVLTGRFKIIILSLSQIGLKLSYFHLLKGKK